jgi:transposase
MIAIGIDVGKRHHDACLLDADGQPVGQPLPFANSAAGVRQFATRVQGLGEPVTIGLEASGVSWLGLHRHLTAAGWLVQVINPVQTEAFRTTGVRKTKTDRRDAAVIADLVRIGRARPSYVPDETILQLRELTRFRWSLVDQIGDAKRRVLTLLDRVFRSSPPTSPTRSGPVGASCWDGPPAFRVG